MYIKVLSVSALNNYIKKVMDNDFILSNVYVRGEISNLKVHNSGHVYFSLKDEYGKISAVMFRSDAEGLDFVPENGMNVEVVGRVSTYLKEGTYQLYCNKMVQVGIGELFAAFIKLKEKLEKEGLFKDEYKKEIPQFPRRIGVITSPTGAAVRDIINVAKRRNSKVNLLIYPSLVQGKGASEEIIKGIQYLNSMEDIDTIIIARGGGSIEELWSFNDEALAYEVFKSKKPIISGVGHETDFTIIDFVSDRRAPTPSAAAEIAVPSIRDFNERVNSLQIRLGRVFERELSSKRNILERYKSRLELNNPVNYIVNSYNTVDNLKSRLMHSMQMVIGIKKEQLARANALLGAHNPLNILNKGYAVIQDEENKVISSSAVLKTQDSIYITLKDGKVKANVCFKGE
ncbi:exodeoxyribonuclease VII large subunit [Clostridium thermarum]|uniref:exodeoxyribonuclease VII large subunit n=1 Tax=Clostridium thermarum TaxID=1716543 RepID=UPI0013D62526|nr:exodeoxyribonuclease VII large subunit [Clostridium thermarum]